LRKGRAQPGEQEYSGGGTCSKYTVYMYGITNETPLYYSYIPIQKYKTLKNVPFQINLEII
jgi:hypothetical protein